MQNIISLFEKNLWLRLCLCALASVAMLVFILVFGSAITTNILQTAFYGAVLLALYILPIIAEKNIPLAYMAVGAIGAAALVYVRLSMFFFESPDYINFLSNWLKIMRELPLLEAMSTDIGDYNMPYLYILFIISRLNLNELFLIKFVSCIFDALAAFFVLKIMGHFGKSSATKITAYILTLALPTVWLNGAYWGQCDVMFTSLCIGMFYAILKGKGNLATILWGLAFSFKLQAIFALPILIIGLFLKRIKFVNLFWIPAVFAATLLPAFVCGRSIKDCIKIYYLQANQYPKLNLNIASIWAMVNEVSFEHFNSAAIFLAGAALLVFLFLCYHYKDRIDDQKLVYLFFIGALLVPYLLPRMHDRYFFLADLAALIVFLIDHKKWYVPIVTVFTSYVSYCYYVMGGQYIVKPQILSIAILILLTISIKDVFLPKKETALM